MKTVTGKKYGISAAALKWIAVITMLIDHFAVAIYMQFDGYNYIIYRAMRYIGRISFPIYCFLLAEGFFHTKNIGKYIRNCFIFAIISEIPFDMALSGHIVYPYGQNIFFTLSIGLCALYVLDRFKGKYDIKYILVRIVIIVLFAYAGEILEVDYHWKGILFIIMFYYCRNFDVWTRNIIGICAFAYEVTAPIAFIPITFYNGERGRQTKYLFYGIYPVHLFIYGLIRFYMRGLF